MAMVPVPISNAVVPGGTRVNFLSVLVTLGFTAVGGIGLLLAGSIASIVAAVPPLAAPLISQTKPFAQASDPRLLLA